MRPTLPVAALLSGLAAACASHTLRSGTLDRGDARIHYVEAGAGPAVVLIHGWALSLREWDDEIAALAPDFHVIAFDRRGFGRSTGDADPSADPGDLRALLDTLHVRTASLVGHSAGADIAQRFAAAMPGRVDALVLYGGAPPAGFPGEPPASVAGDRLKQMARQLGIDSVKRIIFALPQFQPGPHRSAAAAARVDSILARYTWRDLLEDHPPSGAFPPARLDQELAWRMPVLYIAGDREAPAWQRTTDSLVRWMHDARKVVVPGGGHAVHLDEPARFDAALQEFLTQVQRGR